MREIRTSGLMSGGLETQSREPNCRHGAKETVKVLSRASIETVAGFIDESGW